MVNVDTIITRFVDEGGDSLRSTFAALGKDASTLEGRLERIGAVSNLALGAGAGLASALGLVGAASLKSAGQVEGVTAGFTSMLGSADAAQAKIKEISKFARDTPFDFGQSAAAAQQLLAMGFTGEELIPTMKKVGNAVAAAGGSTDQFRGVLTALGQIRTKGKLSAEELMQIAERGIPVYQILQKELGMTQAEVAKIGESGIDANKGIQALIKGMGDVGGGTGLEEMSKTLPAKISALSDTVMQLNASIGTLFSNDAKGFLEGVTDRLDGLKNWVDENPDLAKKVFQALGIGAGALVLGGAAGKAAGIYNDITTALSKTTKAKKALEAATRADDQAEKMKAATALLEGDAIGRVGGHAADTTKKLGLLARTKDALTKPLEIGGKNFQIPAALRGAFGGRGASMTLGNIGAKGGARTLGLVTGAGAAASAAIGAAVGYGATDDYSALGDPNALMKGAATGIAATAAAMFLPGAAIPVAIATGFRYAFNELVNRPMEREAEGGDTGSQISEDIAKKGPQSQMNTAAAYLDKARKLQAEADAISTTLDFAGDDTARKRALEAEAESSRILARNLMRDQRRKDRAASDGSTVADSTWVYERFNATPRKSGGVTTFDGRPEHQRNGETVIRIPNRPADNAYRRRRNQSMSPVPRYA